MRNAEKHMPNSYDPMTEIALGLSMIFFTMMILISLSSQDQQMRKGLKKSGLSTQPGIHGAIGRVRFSEKQDFLIYDGKNFLTSKGLLLKNTEIKKLIEEGTHFHIILRQNMNLNHISYLENKFYGKQLYFSIIKKNDSMSDEKVQ